MFLEENAERIEQAIRDVFAGSEDLEVRGTLINFDYTHIDCSDLRHLGSRMQPKNCGAGIRIAVKFNDDEVRRFYYPERECNNVREFLDNLNTDFGMAQVMHGNTTRSLKIFHYDLQENMIRFDADDGREIEVKQFDQCWDVNTLTFYINAFLAIKSAAEKEGALRSSPKGLFDASIVKPMLPASIKALGIDRDAFLGQSEKSNTKSM